MAARESDIQQLRTQLQASRWQLHDTIQTLEDKFNVPRRIKTEVREHPLKWAALAVGVGVAVAIAAPFLLRAGSKTQLRNLIVSALRLAAVAALPALARATKLRGTTRLT